MKTVLRVGALLMVALVVGACKQSVEPPPPVMYTVTFDSMEGTPVGSIKIEQGHKLGVYPYNSTKENKVFIGWYADESITERVTAETVIEKDTILYARWDEPVAGSNGLTYVERGDGTAIVTGIGTFTGAEVQIANNYNGFPVTAIGESAFYHSSLTSVIIPDSVTTIGEMSFLFCKSLISIEIPNSVEIIGDRAIYGCDTLTSITIGNSVRKLGIYVFSGCANLTEITCNEKNKSYSSENGVLYNKDKTILLYYPIGKEKLSFEVSSTVEIIGEGAFRGCSKLTSVIISNSVKTIREQAFIGCDSLINVKIGDNITAIEQSAFSLCSNLTSLTVPKSVRVIDAQAFYGCYALKEVKFQEGLTTLGDGSFGGCASLTDLSIPDSVEKIGDLAFENCEALASVTIGEGVKTIGYNAFSNCEALTSVTIGEGVETIGSGAFSNCTGLTRVTIGESVKTIGSDAFFYCTGLTRVTIGENVKSIGASAFSYCKGLQSVVIPNSIVTIGEEAFSVTRLTDVTIPYSVENLNQKIFYGCSEDFIINVEGRTEAEKPAWNGVSSTGWHDDWALKKSYPTKETHQVNWNQ